MDVKITNQEQKLRRGKKKLKVLAKSSGKKKDVMGPVRTIDDGKANQKSNWFDEKNQVLDWFERR